MLGKAAGDALTWPQGACEHRPGGVLDSADQPDKEESP
jgi:hypothetical protein